MIYTFESRIRYSEIDHHGTITLPGIINYFQDCSTFQSEDIGAGLEVLREKKRAWLLSYWQVVVERYPALGEKVTVGTFAYGFRGLFGERCGWQSDCLCKFALGIYGYRKRKTDKTGRE